MNAKDKYTMKINEIFYSLQGEGFHTGTPAIFIRFSGCNLKCDFCDTLHNEGKQMSEDEIISEVSKYPAPLVVLTGGEPTLQVTSSLCDKLHAVGKFIAIETNGTNEIPEGIDWITCSPKYITPIISFCDEIKVVYEGQDMAQYDHIKANHHYLQPCDRKDPEKNAENTAKVIEYCLAHPDWRISIQTQKILNVR